MQLSISLGNDLTQLVRFGFGQSFDIDAVEKALRQNFLHQPSFVQALSRTGAAVGGADQGTQTSLVGNTPRTSLPSLDGVRMARR